MSSWATRAASVSPSSVVAAIDAMITGDELMLSAVTCGLTVAGSPAFWRFCSIAARISLTSEPNENWAIDERERVGGRGLEGLEAGHARDRRSIGFVTWSATSAAPAPGERRDDGDDRELDVRQELLLEVAPGEQARDEQGAGEQQRDAPLGDGELGEAAHAGSFRVAASSGATVAPARGAGMAACGRRAASARSVRSGLASSVVVEVVEEVAHLAGVELAEAVDERGACGRQADDHLAAVDGVLAARGEAVVDDPVDEAAHRGQRDAEALDEIGHVELARRAQEVQELGLGHRDGDLEELRGVAARRDAA